MAPPALLETRLTITCWLPGGFHAGPDGLAAPGGGLRGLFFGFSRAAPAAARPFFLPLLFPLPWTPPAPAGGPRPFSLRLCEPSSPWFPSGGSIRARACGRVKARQGNCLGPLSLSSGACVFSADALSRARDRLRWHAGRAGQGTPPDARVVGAPAQEWPPRPAGDGPRALRSEDGLRPHGPLRSGGGRKRRRALRPAHA